MANPYARFVSPKEENPYAHFTNNPDTSWRQTIIESFNNIPESAIEFGKSLITPIIHPKQTAKALYYVGKGGLEKLTPEREKEEKYFDAIVDFYKNRYKSTDNFKQTIAKDPIGVLADVATVIGVAGGTVRAAGTVGGLSKVTTTGKAISKMGMTLEPVNLARGIAALPLKLVPEKVPMNLYQSAVKFGTTLSSKERNTVTRTAISASNQIMPTSKGMIKLRNMIDDYNTQISDKINDATTANQTIKIDDLYRGLDNIVDQMKQMSDEPTRWDKAYNQIKKEWTESLNLGDTRTPQQVQKIKTTIYKNLESLYEQYKSSPAKATLRKAIAKNAKEQLEIIIPEIKQLNQKEGALIELFDAIEAKSNRITNRDIISIGLPVKMGTGAGVGYMFGGEMGGQLGSQIGLALGVFDIPQNKAKIALILNRLREKGITISPTTIARLSMLQMGRIEEQTQ